MNDPMIQDVIDYWKNSVCPGILCGLAAPGFLQCVSFVRGVLFMAGHPIGPAGDGRQFYTDPARALTGWAKISPGQMPRAGDIISWSNGKNPETGQANPGHVAIIVQVNLPAAGRDGDVIVADSNVDGNYLNPISQKNSLRDFKLNAALTVQAWPGFTLEGYRRPPAAYLTGVRSASRDG